MKNKIKILYQEHLHEQVRTITREIIFRFKIISKIHPIKEKKNQKINIINKKRMKNNLILMNNAI